ncbi:MAG: hypothetical protein ACLKAK_12960 [Alkaliphilus sp.]
MKKKLLIELIIYAVIVVIGIILLFKYEPKEHEIIIPSDFKIQTEVERGEVNVTIPNE